MWDVVVVGAGAAGLIAAERAAQRGRKTLLLEKNRKAGVKILMSGGTRCNITQATDSRGIVDAFGSQGRFLHGPLAVLSPDDVVALVEAEGVATKIEPTGKIFPASDKASDVLRALLKRLRRSGCTLALDEPLVGIDKKESHFRLRTTRRTISAAKVIVTTGGKSYPGCGTTGDGYTWTADMGHTIVPPRPALTPVTSNDGWVRELKGVTIEDVELQVIQREGVSSVKRIHSIRRRGSFLFTHFGLSGPAALDVSREITGHPRPAELDLLCDFLPTMDEQSLDGSLQRESRSAGKKRLSAILASYLPKRLAAALLSQAKLSPQLPVAELGARGRKQLVEAVKRQRITVSGTRGFKKAEVTAGGVALDEVASRDMQSRMVGNLYLAGEILDLDGPIGGYNFQAAFSTGFLAGDSV